MKRMYVLVGTCLMTLGSAAPYAAADPPQQCGGIGGFACPEGQICRFAIGACFPDASGVCRNAPAQCPPGGQDVCGCNGKTYNNRCEAEMAGVVIASTGPCEGGGCANNQDCAAGEYCSFPDGTCGPAGGQCEPRPDLCPTVFDPVCGCDGQTYSNSCFAAMAGVSVDFQGACVSVGCASNADCASTDYCAFADGTCGPAGQCEPRPEACIQIFDPVCGCDGQTYGNACNAASNGVSVAQQGECP